MEDEFADAIKSRGDDFKFFQDQYGEHPDERAVKNEELTEKLGDIQTLTSIYGGLKDKVGKHVFWIQCDVIDTYFASSSYHSEEKCTIHKNTV